MKRDFNSQHRPSTSTVTQTHSSFKLTSRSASLAQSRTHRADGKTIKQNKSVTSTLYSVIIAVRPRGWACTGSQRVKKAPPFYSVCAPELQNYDVLSLKVWDKFSRSDEILFTTIIALWWVPHNKYVCVDFERNLNKAYISNALLWHLYGGRENTGSCGIWQSGSVGQTIDRCYDVGHRCYNRSAVSRQFSFRSRVETKRNKIIISYALITIDSTYRS